MTTTQDDRREDGWHLDKKVPIGIIAAMLFQFFTGIWFVSKLDSRVQALEGQQTTMVGNQRDRDERQDRASAEAFALMRAQLEKMDTKLDRLIERPKN